MGGAANDLPSAQLQHLSRKATVHGAEKNPTLDTPVTLPPVRSRDPARGSGSGTSIAYRLTSLMVRKYRRRCPPHANSSRSFRHAQQPLHICAFQAAIHCSPKSLAVQASCFSSQRERSYCQFQSMAVASPPPMHRLATPRLNRISAAAVSVTMMRAPDNRWGAEAQAPPWHVDLVVAGRVPSSPPSSPQEGLVDRTDPRPAPASRAGKSL